MLCAAWFRSRASSSLPLSSGSAGCSRAWSCPWSWSKLRSPRAAHQPDPAGAGKGVQSQRHESERDDADEYVSVGLVEQKEERAAEALDLARIVVDAGLDQEPTDD